LRKKPVWFVRGQRTAAVVWETNECGEEVEWGVRWKEEGKNAEEWEEASVDKEAIFEEEGKGARIVYTAALEGLEGYANFKWELFRRSDSTSSPTVFAKSSFPWIGARFPPAFVIPVGKPPPTLPPTTLHIACVADNQFNLRFFRRILLRLSSFGRSLASSYFSSIPSAFTDSFPKPHLLLHAGDIVQNPHDLAQWQTDAFDPLTRSGGVFSSSSSPPPVLLARGNHDWDATGRNPYTGGLSPSASLRADYLSHLSSSSSSVPPSASRGTYFSFSPHPRFRLLILDSNLPTLEKQQAQEEWIKWETERDEWKRASVRAAVVHTAPWIEWWDQRAWTEGGESQWCVFFPLLLKQRREKKIKY
jgi:hypothetical protein